MLMSYEDTLPSMTILRPLSSFKSVKSLQVSPLEGNFGLHTDDHLSILQRTPFRRAQDLDISVNDAGWCEGPDPTADDCGGTGVAGEVPDAVKSYRMSDWNLSGRRLVHAGHRAAIGNCRFSQGNFGQYSQNSLVKFYFLARDTLYTRFLEEDALNE